VTADSLAKKRSLRTDRRVQLTTVASKTSSPSPTKHSQRSLVIGTASSPSTVRSARAKVVDLEMAEKSGGASSDDGGGSCGVPTESEKSKDWIHLTHRELHGLKDLVAFLESLDVDNRHVPSEVQSSADELLSSAKVMNKPLNDEVFDQLIGHISSASIQQMTPSVL